MPAECGDHCRVERDRSVQGFQAVVLENRALRAVVLPRLGAKVWELTYKPADRQWLYHNPRCPLRAPVHGANFDNWWSGGLDECLPSGHASRYKGEDYPYMGETWALDWDWQVTEDSGERVELYMSAQTVIAPLRVERWDSLSGGERCLRQRHRVTNVGYEPCEFLWGIHPTFAISPDCRIDLPGATMWVDESTPDARLGPRGSTYRWPFAADGRGIAVDVRQVRGHEALTQDFHYANDLPAGWAALTDARQRVGIAHVFPTDVFPTAWLWLVYGGWRSLYVAALEAWTGYPARLHEAAAMGKCSRLAPAQSLEAETVLLAYEGVSSVGSISPSGVVTE